MYLKLGNTKINYNSSRDEFIILAQILSGGTIGYESPVLVHSLEELDIWFGREFKDREYIAELLRSNEDLAFLLSKPLSPIPKGYADDWIDLDKYSIDPGIYYGQDMFPPKGQTGVIYRVIEDVTAENYEDWIWTDGEFYIPVKDLPQNINSGNSISLLNRDTLRIGLKKLDNKDEEGKEKVEYAWSYPSMQTLENEDYSINPADEFWEGVDLEKIDMEEETLAFLLTLPPEESLREQGNYLLLDSILFYTGENLPQVSDQYYTYTFRVETINDLIQALKGELQSSIPNSEYINNRKWEVEEKGEEVLIWKETPTKVTYFYNWSGLSLEPNLRKTQEIISSHLAPVIQFWSKTIGRCREETWDEDNIKITIDQSTENPEIWRTTIKRYDYTEVFEGTLYPSSYRLDRVIEEGSKLIHAQIPDYLIPYLKELPKGTYQLKGATNTDEGGSNEEKFNYTLKQICQEGDKLFFPDFILIPDPEEYMNEETAKEVYQRWIDIASQYSLQFLIQNSDKNVDWNLTTDTENRLVWFWEGMKVRGNERPGYYLFLKGLLTDKYSMTSKYLIYNLPTLTPYSEDLTTLENRLIKDKSNYLVCNNQMYYYKEYQNGETWDTTILMRFVMGKINRELEKNMGQYLGSMTLGGMMEIINGILEGIKNRFTIIRSISISNSDVSYIKQKVALEIETTISDLAQNTMTLDVVINYNKNN